MNTLMDWIAGIYLMIIAPACTGLVAGYTTAQLMQWMAIQGQ